MSHKNFEQEAIERLNEVIGILRRVKKQLPKGSTERAELEKALEMVKNVEEGLAHC